MILHNAADEEQLRHLVLAAPKCLVLVTSRRTLMGSDGASVQMLDASSEAEAVELLGWIVGDERVAA